MEFIDQGYFRRYFSWIDCDFKDKLTDFASGEGEGRWFENIITGSCKDRVEKKYN